MDQAWSPIGEGRFLIGALLGQEEAVVFRVSIMAAPLFLQTHLFYKIGTHYLHKITVFIVSVFKCKLKTIRNALAPYTWI